MRLVSFDPSRPNCSLSRSASGRSCRCPLSRKAGQLRVRGADRACGADRRSAAGRTVRPALSIDEAVEAGARAEPRHPDPAVRPADSGRRHRAGASFWAPNFSSTIDEELADASSRRARSRAAATSILNGQFSTARRRSASRCRGAAATRQRGTARGSPRPTICQQLQPAARLEPERCSITQPLLRNFEIDQIRQQVAISKKSRELSDIQLQAVVTQTLRNVQERLLGSRLRDQQPEGAAAVAGAVAAVAEGQPEARRDRHDGADRHRPGAGRSRQQRAGRDRRRGGDQAGAGQPARADSRPGDAGLLDRRLRADRRGVVRRAGDRRRRGGAQRARQAAGSAQSAKNSLEQSDINIKYYRNQIMPDVNAQRALQSRPASAARSSVTVDLGGDHRRPIDRTDRRRARLRLGARRRVQNAYPNWTVGVQIGYPLGASTAHANLARVKLQYEQAQTQLKNLEMQVATQVRERRAATCRPTSSACSRRAPRASCRRRSSRPKRRSSPPACRRPSSSSRRSATSRWRARPRSRRSPTTTSRSSTSRPCSRCRSTAAAVVTVAG